MYDKYNCKEESPSEMALCLEPLYGKANVPLQGLGRLTWVFKVRDLRSQPPLIQRVGLESRPKNILI